ncbi:glycosyltransferase [Acetobacterium paludosum]|uniref:Glycosyltransferase n=1 Tax=Acetobacterium paludosum TaxID=52693 RepID=A0A923KRR4_9FIRM|nr:glycosyltransferase family A protein [Acetobacterium paludosum]MBC3887542.1 glycosyltransferase [Acetobacterium paludosum]
MKYISFVVPCYNSEDYMNRCIDSLLCAGNDVEIIIINDGSTDKTREIAEDYSIKYPDMIKVINKENGGHGSGVNVGLENATGIYFKVVDSDDWLDRQALDRLMFRIRDFCLKKQSNPGTIIPDLFICNYVYDHLYEETHHDISYKNVLDDEKLCRWKDIGNFRASQYLLMHSQIFKTAILRKSGVKLPEHTFYVDNIFAYQPLPYVEHLYYMNVDLYHYFIGREDQSVNEDVMLSRIDQQIRVTERMLTCVDLHAVKKNEPRLAAYMYRYLSIIMSITNILLLMINSEESMLQKNKLWNEIKSRDKNLYRKLKYTSMSGLTNMPGSVGRKLSISGYRVAQKIYKFN